MPRDRTADDDRLARISAMLEELRRTTDELHKLAEASRERARRTVAESQTIKARVRKAREPRTKRR